ncbi:MAG: CRISPR-associated helicase/endonuclease Cas3 [Candidatus Methanoperedenaceae archaeon HGW-Methanoperedenaceae-1]|nr:MAG: CRISPR-associated helicase/endonuclease Cas3 [Candidatus Methanoperedenaceae archaeon HGW-Methanoperedenaceae-1]
MYQNWGKANKPDSQDASSYHLLVYHCLDVAAVGQVLLQKDKHLLKRFTDITTLSDEVTTNLITFYLAIHDIGKFSDRFQNLRPDIFEHLRGCTYNKPYNVRHDTMGYHLWDSVWSPLWEDNLLHLEQGAGIEKIDWHDILKSWVQAVTGHHGKPPLLDDNGMTIRVQNLFTDENIAMAQSFVNEVAELLIPDQANQLLISYDKDMEDSFKRSSWLLAGLAILSDWIGSNSEYFPLNSKPMSLEDYWNNIALPKAEDAIKTAGVLPSGISSETGMGALFPKIDYPSPLQSHVSTCELADGAQLFILEEVTGSGKTEAALTLAHRLMNRGLGEGIFVALPTMATANAMYERLVEAYGLMFAAEATPSLVLAHSARHLSDKFRHSIGLEHSSGDGVYARDEEAASAQCSEWLADNRKKALLADVGVGTIDQGLMAVLPSKHQSLRLLGLSRNVLIVDEVHAYDPYMHTLLCTLLRFHAALGGSAILLSATLPIKQRQELVNSFSQGLDGKQHKLNENSYPLVTHSTGNCISQTPLHIREGTQRKVAVKFFDDISAVESSLVNTAKNGGCACWIRNTVDDAVDAYNTLSSKLGSENILLFHARFAMGDRQRIEKKVLDTFGKKGGNDIRRGKILVATQVVEQSLDLDFDYMVSDLAPMDLIIQRAGRLHRHTRNERSGTAILGIFAPCLTDAPTENWYKDVFPKAAYVYPSHGQLWLTASLLSKHGELVMPDDARNFIEGVFGSNTRNDVPDALRNRDDKAKGDDMAAISIAKLNRLLPTKGYGATVGQWLDDTRTPTRLGELTTNVRLARWDGKIVLPWMPDEKYVWELSQVSISQRKIKDMVKYDGALKAGLEKAMNSMPDKGKWAVIIPLSKADGDKWHGSAINGHGERIQVIYDSIAGLSTIQEN